MSAGSKVMYGLSLCNDRADILFWCSSWHLDSFKHHWDLPSNVLAQTILLIMLMVSYWAAWYQHYCNGSRRGLLDLGNYTEAFGEGKRCPVVLLFNMQLIRVVLAASGFLSNKNEIISKKQPSPLLRMSLLLIRLKWFYCIWHFFYNGTSLIKMSFWGSVVQNNAQITM